MTQADPRVQHSWPVGPTLLTLVLLAVLISLGFWQLQRKAWKEAMLAHVAANRDAPALVLTAADGVTPDQEFRKALLTCTPDPDGVRTIAEFGPDRRIGVRAFVPCLIGRDVIVVRARWAPEASPTPAGSLKVAGRIRFWKPPTLAEQAGGITPPGPALFAGSVAVFYLDQDGQIPHLPNDHLAYAVQWFGFAATLGAVYGVYLLRWRRQMLKPRP